MAQTSKVTNKNFFAFKMVQFCDLKTEQRYILQEEVDFFQKILSCFVGIVCDFRRTFDETSKNSQPK